MFVLNGIMSRFFLEGGVSRRAAALLSFAVVIFLAAGVSASSWPDIPASDFELTSVPDHPSAPAVVLYETGRLVLNDNSLSCYLEIYRRTKVLTEEGTAYGSVQVVSSPYYRMKELEARTHLPDGRIVELPSDAVFSSEYDEYYNARVTSFAMPEVAVGAIVEYRFKVYFDTALYPRPWYFQSKIPVLYSQFSCVVPSRYSFYPDAVQTLRSHEMEHRVDRNALGIEAIYIMRDMPPVPAEPYRYPFADLSSRVTFLPVAHISMWSRIALFEDWESTIKLAQGEGSYGYKHFRTSSRKLAAEAKRIAAEATTPRDRAERLYRYVRDEIVTEHYPGVLLGDRRGDEALKNGRGTYVEKALMLQVMLDEVGIDAEIGWSNPANVNHINQNVPNTAQFDTPLVVIALDGQRAFLDPRDRTLAFGRIHPQVEGMPCLLVDRKKPQWITLPETPADGSRQHAVLDLSINGDGRIAGTGTLELSGHEAWRKLGWKDTAEETRAAWQQWLEDHFSGYDVDDVGVDELIDDTLVTVKWTMTQREEEVLGDEATVSPSAPLGQPTNPFSLAVDQRLTPVHLPYRSIDTVDLTLHWPEGWLVEARPEERSYHCIAGALSASCTIDEASRVLTASRSMELSQRDFIGPDAYRILKGFLDTAVRADAETIVLARE